MRSFWKWTQYLRNWMTLTLILSKKKMMSRFWQRALWMFREHSMQIWKKITWMKKISINWFLPHFQSIFKTIIFHDFFFLYRFYYFWLYVLGTIFVYNLFYIPFSLCFMKNIEGNWIIFDIMTIIINFLDIFIDFQTKLNEKSISCCFKLIKIFFSKGKTPRSNRI